jgi:hypothetical protein
MVEHWMKTGRLRAVVVLEASALFSVEHLDAIRARSLRHAIGILSHATSEEVAGVILSTVPGIGLADTPEKQEAREGAIAIVSERIAVGLAEVKSCPSCQPLFCQKLESINQIQKENHT